MQSKNNQGHEVIDIPMDQEVFLRNLLNRMTGTLQDIIGVDEAAGFVSMVGHEMGDWINRLYLHALNTPRLNREQVIQVLVDMKRRIGSDFEVADADEDRIILSGHCCPFGEAILERPCLCRMTTSVIGSITAANLGYARLSIDHYIAQKETHCRLVIHLKEGDMPAVYPEMEFFGI